MTAPFAYSAFLLSLLILGTGCCSIPDGTKQGSLVDAGEKNVSRSEELTEQAAENAFCAAFIIWKVENALSGPVPVYLCSGGKNNRFRQGLAEAGAAVSESKRGAYLLEEERTSGKRTFALREPSGKTVLVRSYRIRRNKHE